MAQALLPSNPTSETARLAALRGLRLLDTAPTESFDRVTRLAAAGVDVPIVLLSLVDETRQWFKSRFNFDTAQTPREVSFCSHAVELREPLVVCNALVDERFRNNPLVTGAPHIRAYLGVPIYTRQGHAIGALCAIDQRPHPFDAEDVRLMGDFARIVQDAIQAQESVLQSSNLLQLAGERESLFRDSFELAPVGMVHASLTGRLLRANSHLADLLGFTPAELEQLTLVDLTHPHDLKRATDPFRRLAAGGIDRYQIEKRLQRRDGLYLWCRLAVVLKRAVTHEPDYLLAVVEDISTQRALAQEMSTNRDALNAQVAEQTRQLLENNEALRSHAKELLESEIALRHTEHRLRAITNHVPAMISYWNHDLLCEFCNVGYRSFFGLDPARILGMRMRDLLGEARFESIEPYTRGALAGQVQHFEMGTRRPDDSRDVHLDITYMPDIEAGDVRGFIVLINDVTQARTLQLKLEEANAKLLNDSSCDYLTGLANRTAFHQRGEEATRRFQKHGDLCGLLLVDLDNFKAINEDAGFDAGDAVLKRIAALLRAQMRSARDCAARLNGAEFGMLCFGSLDEDLLQAVAAGLSAQIGRENISASIGVALIQSTDGDWRRLYVRAESALREAKLEGRGQVALARSAA